MQVIPTNAVTPPAIFFYLVDATDFNTPEDISVSGVKPTVYVGGTVLSGTAADIVKVSGTVGLYSWTPTQAQINVSVGQILTGYIKPTGCAPALFAAQIGATTVFTATPQSDDIAAAVITASETTPIEANVVQMNSAPVIGDGTEADLWRGVE